MTSSTPEQLIEQLRDRLRWSWGMLYLTYYGFWLGAHEPKTLTSIVTDARTWIAVAAVTALATAIVPSAAPLRSRGFLHGLTGLGALTTLAFVYQTLTRGEGLAEMMVWLNVMILLVFVSLWSLPGLILTGIMLLVMVIILLTGQAQLFSDVMVLMAALFSSVMTIAAGFLIMKFIEQHLHLHEQTTDQLAAARKDALTAVLGRAAIEEELRRTIQHARKTGTPLSLIVTDIDHFKRVNDQFGHGAGDDVLRAFAKRLRRNVGGSGGIVGRWGGEEFVVLLPGVARPDALVMAERLRQEVSCTPIADHAITASFGLASFRREDDLDTLFGRADERLYEAKNAGRNTVRA